jgi:hypothetical protein
MLQLDAFNYGLEDDRYKADVKVDNQVVETTAHCNRKAALRKTFESVEF